MFRCCGVLLHHSASLAAVKITLIFVIFMIFLIGLFWFTAIFSEYLLAPSAAAPEIETGSYNASTGCRQVKSRHTYI